jgi:hypothetical protein
MLAATPPHVRKVYDLPLGPILIWGYAPITGHSSKENQGIGPAGQSHRRTSGGRAASIKAVCPSAFGKHEVEPFD